MVLTETPRGELGWEAADFELPGVDGKTHKLADLAGEKGTVVAFICNHCPYVVAIKERMVADAEHLKAIGVNFIAICSNDAKSYPADSFEKMVEFSDANKFSFPYLHDESQNVAKAYDAVCTPDFFGFDGEMKLGYRGRLDEGRTGALSSNVKRELVEAMEIVSNGGNPPEPHHPSIGCSIKWK